MQCLFDDPERCGTWARLGLDGNVDLRRPSVAALGGVVVVLTSADGNDNVGCRTSRCEATPVPLSTAFVATGTPGDGQGDQSRHHQAQGLPNVNPAQPPGFPASQET